MADWFKLSETEVLEELGSVNRVSVRRKLKKGSINTEKMYLRSRAGFNGGRYF